MSFTIHTMVFFMFTVMHHAIAQTQYFGQNKAISRYPQIRDRAVVNLRSFFSGKDLSYKISEGQELVAELTGNFAQFSKGYPIAEGIQNCTAQVPVSRTHGALLCDGNKLAMVWQNEQEASPSVSMVIDLTVDLPFKAISSGLKHAYI